MMNGRRLRQAACSQTPGLLAQRLRKEGDMKTSLRPARLAAFAGIRHSSELSTQSVGLRAAKMRGGTEVWRDVQMIWLEKLTSETVSTRGTCGARRSPNLSPAWVRSPANKCSVLCCCLLLYSDLVSVRKSFVSIECHFMMGGWVCSRASDSVW